MAMYDMKWSTPRKLAVKQSEYYDYYINEPDMRSLPYCFQYFRLICYRLHVRVASGV